jgi:hypothetical protein
VFLISLAMAAAAASDQCQYLQGQIDGFCAPTARGAVVASSRARADTLALHLRAAEARYTELLGREIKPYVVVEREGGKVTAVERETLKLSGFAFILPWLPFDKLQSEGGAVAQASRDEDSTLPHEAAHLWLEDIFGSQQRPGQYGTPKADWFDETIPVLMESDAQSARRRKSFWLVYAGQGKGLFTAYDRAKLVDLRSFFEVTHPGTEAVRQKLAEKKDKKDELSGSGISVIEFDDSRDTEMMSRLADATLFYSKSRVFADYLFDRTGDRTIFARIAMSLSAGRPFAEWLKHEGAASRLPSTLDDLQANWEAWLSIEARKRSNVVC